MKTIWLTLLLAAVTLCAAESRDPRKEIAELRLKDGTVLHHVQIVSFSSTAAMARWDEGRGTIPYEKFPEEWQEELSKFIPAQSFAPIKAASRHAKDYLSDLPSVNMTRLETLPEPPGERQTISGQCFVVTKGGVNVKMGLVEVSVYPLQAFTAYSDQIHRRSAARFDLMTAYAFPRNPTKLNDKSMQRSVEVRQAYLIEKYAIWSLLPPPLASTTTDADGKFSMTHNVAPPYVIFARGSRRVGDTEERYVWRVTSDKIRNPEQVIISNDDVE